MESLELNQQNHWVLWKTEAGQAGKSEIAWHMLENNEIAGLLPFDYYYLDNQICFRYAYHTLQRIEDFFQKKKGDFDTLCFLCQEVAAILERGQEYLLDDGGYLIQPEWIFWNRHEKKVFLCYLPGREGNAGKDYTTLVEYLMQYTDHSDKNAVSFIYGLYDMLITDGFVPENILSFLQNIKREKEQENNRKQIQEKENKKEDAKISYLLKPLFGKGRGHLAEKMFCVQDAYKCPLIQGKLAVGREAGNDLYLPFGTVSRHHALLFCEPDGFFLMDTTSTNGTYLNGSQISAYVKTPCVENDIITFADISYQLVKA